MTPTTAEVISLTDLPEATSVSRPTPLFGAITLAATFGVELMLIAFIAWGRISDRTGRRDFTIRAWAMYYPERDLKIYVAGIALTLLMMTMFCWGWVWLARANKTARSLTIFAAVQVGLAIAGLLGFLTFLSSRLPLDKQEVRPAMSLSAALALIGIGIATIVAGALDARLMISSRLRRLLVWFGPLLMTLSIHMQLLLAPAAMEIEMVIVLAVLWYWLRIRRSLDRESWESHKLRRSAVLAAMAIGSFVTYLTLLPVAEPTQTGSLIQDPLDFRTRIPVFAMILCVLIDTHWGASIPDVHCKRRRKGRSQLLVDIGVPLLLFATIFVPRSRWPFLSGSFFQIDELHHWNFFALGPAMEVAHGRALVTDVFSQYGVGWPWLFAMLRRALKLNYANLIGAGIIYGCLYILALYGFLRWLLRDAIWASCGAILAATLQIFSGTGADAIIWNFPSSTMLRHPMDVWCFFLLLAHLHFGGKKWLIAAGAICGLALLFELDTGVELVMTFCFFWLLDQWRRSGWRGLASASSWIDLLLAGLLAGLVWLAGMAISSRGTILHSTFWSEYFEGLHNQAFSGLGLLPIANVSGYGLLIFAGMLTIYFFAIGLAGARIWLGNGSEIDLFIASISAYGLGLLLLFVGRSHLLNLFHPMIPLAVVVVLLMYDFRFNAARDVQWTSFPWIFAAASLAMLWTKPEFSIYPSLAQSVLIGSAPIASPENAGPLALSHSDLAGLPKSMRTQVRDIQEIVNAIDHLRVGDRDLVVLDDRDTLIYLLSNRAPWSRYSSIFHSLLTKSLIAQAETELLKRRPKYVIMRAAPPEKWEFRDSWGSFHHLVTIHYQLERTINNYDVWRKKS